MRDPMLEVYDRACDLLGAAQHFRRALARPGAERDIAPTLGCLQAATGELARGLEELKRRLHRESAAAPRVAALVEAIELIGTALATAETACDEARAVSARIAFAEAGDTAAG